MKYKNLPVLLALVLTIVLGACTSAPAQDVESNPMQTPDEPVMQAAEVTISGFAFDPAELTIQVGTTVTWTNNGSVSHTITSDTGLWNSGNVNVNGTFSYTFDQPGTFNYYCTIHPGMTGTVEVNE